MKKLFLWLILSFCALGQTLPWTGNSSKAWLAQSPNALSIPKAGTYISLSNQTNRLSMSGGRLLLDGVPIGGPTIYTGNGTMTGNRQVDGNNFALDFVNMNNVTINPKGTDFSAGSISGSAANNTRRASLNAGLVRLNATTNVMINEYSLTLPNSAGVIFDSVSNSPASTDEILFRDPSTHIVKWGSSYTAADIGGGGGGQNFANTDLTFTGDRIHDASGFILNINNLYGLHFESDASQSDNLTFGYSYPFYGIQLVSSGDSIVLDVDTTQGIAFKNKQVHDGVATLGQVWTITNITTGKAVWADPPAGPNFANADLTFTGDRLHEASGSGLSVTNLGYLNLYSLGAVRISTGSGGYGNPGQILTSDGTNADWQDPSGASQNFANTDLTADADRNHDFSGFNLSINNSGNFQIISTNDFFVGAGIGPYNTIEATTGSGIVISAPEGLVINAPGNGDPGQVLTSDGTNTTWQNPSFPLTGIPTVSAGAGAGGSPTVTLANETDSAFTLNVTAGTTPATDDDIAVVTFSTAYATSPHYSLSSANKAAANLSGSSAVWATSTTTNLTVHSNTTGLVDGTTYLFEFIVVR